MACMTVVLDLPAVPVQPGQMRRGGLTAARPKSARGSRCA